MFLISFISHVLVAFTNTVLTNSTEPNTKPKGFFANISIWFLSFMALLGICVLFLAIYIIRKFLRRRRRREDEGVKKAAEKKVETVEQTEVAPPETTSALTGINLSSFTEKENLLISERKITENEQSSFSQKEDSSTSVDFIDENCSSTKVGKYTTSSISYTNDYENDLKFKNDDENSLSNTSEDLKTEEVEEKISSHEEELQGEQTANVTNNSDKRDEQEVLVVQGVEIVEKIISKTNKEPEIQKVISNEMNISENLKKEIPDFLNNKKGTKETFNENLGEAIPAKEAPLKETLEETVITVNNKNDESVTNSSSLKIGEALENKVVVTENVLVKEVSPKNPTEKLLYDTEISQKTTLSETSSDEHREESSISKENLNSFEYSPSDKTQNRNVRKSPWARKFSRISSSVLRDARKKVDTSSSENEGC